MVSLADMLQGQDHKVHLLPATWMARNPGQQMVQRMANEPWSLMVGQHHLTAALLAAIGIRRLDSMRGIFLTPMLKLRPQPAAGVQMSVAGILLLEMVPEVAIGLVMLSAVAAQVNVQSGMLLGTAIMPAHAMMDSSAEIAAG